METAAAASAWACNSLCLNPQKTSLHPNQAQIVFILVVVVEISFHIAKVNFSVICFLSLLFQNLLVYFAFSPVINNIDTIWAGTLWPQQYLNPREKLNK